MTTRTDTLLEITRTFGASPERVFAAWTEPAQLARWAAPEGARATAVNVDLRPGGRWRIRMVGEEETYTAYGTYVEVVEPSKLVYTWSWEEEQFDVGETLVTVTFRAVPAGCEVVIRHERFPAAEAVAGHAEGWESCLGRLAGVLDGAAGSR